MSTFWSLYIAFFVILNVVGCYALIKWTEKNRPGDPPIGDKTGHSWDGVEEYNNPMPRWWLIVFYLTLLFAPVYIFLYPSIGSMPSFLDWSATNQYDEEMKEAEETFGAKFKKFATQDIKSLSQNDEAMASGRRLFVTYCSVCHGSDARGVPGFPNLTDNDWLYGGEPAQIKQSIMMGRNGMMPALGMVLGDSGVDEVVNYVMSLSGRKVDETLKTAGKVRFQQMCIGCHGVDGTGNHMIGAPNLTDKTWLYGGSAGTIKKTIMQGRQGKMPPHNNFLGENKSHVLAAYVYHLSKRKE